MLAFIEPSLAGVIAITDDAGRPTIARVWATRVIADQEVEIYVQRKPAKRLLDLLAHERRAALNLVQVTTYRSRMFKGNCVARGEVDQAFARAAVEAQSAAFAAVGLGEDAADRMLGADHDMAVLRLRVDCGFDQSPKPGAGGPL